jgi:signal transduction histidine kinase
MLWLVGLLGSLLVVLAALQWRWAGQLSDHERDRLRASLRRQVSQFAQDVDRELTRAFFWLQLDQAWLEADRSTGGSPNREAAAVPFERWFTSSPHPELIASVYSVERSEPAGVLRLARFDRDRARFVAVDDWPASIAPLRERVERLTVAKGQDEARAAERFEPIDPSIPALVIPRPMFRLTRQPPGTETKPPAPSQHVTIAVLNQAYLTKTFLPTLAQRHFASDGALEYRVAIVERHGGRLVWCSSQDAADCRFDKADADDELFEVRLRDLNRIVGDDRLRALLPRRPSGEHESFRFTVMRTVPPPGAPDRRPERALWEVRVRHEAGSLEAVVARAKWRNLAVSSSVLLLLAAAVGVVIVSAGRARRLAGQQMEFVAGVSHELRTPLAVIRSAADNLADGVVLDEAQVKRYGSLIASEGRRLTQMVEQVMEFAGFEAGRRTLDLRPISVGDVVADAVTASRPHLEDHGFTLDVHVPADLPLVLGDRASLSRSIQNLLSNAVKYAGEGRWVGLSASGGRSPAEVQLAVSDRGPGIAASELPHIFEPFYRGAEAVGAQVHGSGIGLSLVARVMREHGGRVTVDSTPGRGATFTLHVPVAGSAAVVPATGPQTARS